MSDASRRVDYFVSYNQADRAMAEWIGQQTEALGLTVILQAWDFAPGGNFVAAMHDALQRSDRLMLILSAHYLAARYTHEEWQAAFALGRRLLPVKVDATMPPGLLAPIAFIDISHCDEQTARQRLQEGLQPPGRPRQPVPFPGRN